jgi:hypothetical protein
MHNPQSNKVCKRLHQSVGNALQFFLSQAIPFNVMNVAKLVDRALTTALHVLRLNTLHAWHDSRSHHFQLRHVFKHSIAYGLSPFTNVLTCNCHVTSNFKLHLWLILQVSLVFKDCLLVNICWHQLEELQNVYIIITPACSSFSLASCLLSWIFAGSFSSGWVW